VRQDQALHFLGEDRKKGKEIKATFKTANKKEM
jgi:hypothetical protein